MNPFIQYALDFYQGKIDAETFSVEFIRREYEDRRNKTKLGMTNPDIGESIGRMFNACDRFEPELPDDDFNLTEDKFRAEVKSELIKLNII